ncbi:opine metallophore biosynthesis dehydrogenase [Plantactinospora sp. KBS50]|uniref:opine metallophore biosynthesis dehydrogenase n=1 Tax=Plantactinospora sp. KBS50 TaxID=2024580 RepID=UPI000BAAC981|nr:opine metallophore biosynthesis dehydrogenase [Plantactinospora sp. KBS50]ASW56911.1 hypothetical protein CIK06_26265 [Plantactinospora sp. KBS50]
MHDFERVLIAGTGPTTLQLAVLLKNRLGCPVGIAGRTSVRSAAFFADAGKNNNRVRVDVQNDKHRVLAGECVIDELFQGYATVRGEWETLVLAVTADAYTAVLDGIDGTVIERLGCVVLVSPTFGSNSLVRNYLRGRGSAAEVISFSSYLGDTRWHTGAPSSRALTAGVKRRLYVGSSSPGSTKVELLRELHERSGITLAAMASPMDAETRNISLYVHPALFMNDVSLAAVFGDPEPVRYVYKLFPEGPITPTLVNEMVCQWKELTGIVNAMGHSGVNLLQFMLDDSYPVRPESISRQDIERFEKLPAIHQEYLVYVRYASLLVDPFSEPDQAGRYFDFSAIPIRHTFVDGAGRWEVPRMPKEDYYRTKIIQGVARHLGSPCPTVDRLIARYERRIGEAARALAGESLSDAFLVRDFRADLDMICDEISTTRRVAAN